MVFDTVQEEIIEGIKQMLLEDFNFKFSTIQIKKLIEHQSFFAMQAIEAQQEAPIAYIGKFALVPELLTNRYGKKNVEFIENDTYNIIKQKENANVNRRLKIFNLGIENGNYD